MIAESGATYPVRYAYDSLNCRVAMWTNRSGDEWNMTRWTYDSATGLCLAKTYADGTSTTYEYTEDGLLERTCYASGHWERNLYNDKRQIVGVQYDDVESATFERDACRVPTAGGLNDTDIPLRSNPSPSERPPGMGRPARKRAKSSR